MNISILIEDAAWQNDLPDPDAVCRDAAMAALLAGTAALPDDTELSIMLTGDEHIRSLNKQFRGKDTPTNVLAFPAIDGDVYAAAQTAVAGVPFLLGDVVLAHGVVVREATDQAKSLTDHFSHLVIHGVLHLLGHDHMNDNDADHMESLETGILAKLGIADPYRMSAEPS